MESFNPKTHLSNLLYPCKNPPLPPSERDAPSPVAADNPAERVLLLTLAARDPGSSERELAELEGLVRSAGATPVAVIQQRPGSANPQTLWGTGKLQESALEVRRNGASLVITDRELSPVQARNLERLLDCPVMDRSELILDIFAQRAGSAAGRLQVELAQNIYLDNSAINGHVGVNAPGSLGNSGVVDEHVDASECVDDRFHRSRH